MNLGVREITLFQRPPSHGPPVAINEVVKNHRIETGLGEPLRRVAADIPRAADHKYAHRSPRARTLVAPHSCVYPGTAGPARTLAPVNM